MLTIVKPYTTFIKRLAVTIKPKIIEMKVAPLDVAAEVLSRRQVFARTMSLAPLKIAADLG